MLKKAQESSDDYKKKYEKEREANDKLSKFKEGILAAVDRFKTSAKQIEACLACLSCLEFLEKPAMNLVCGHSICKTVSSSHLTALVLQQAFRPQEPGFACVLRRVQDRDEEQATEGL